MQFGEHFHLFVSLWFFLQLFDFGCSRSNVTVQCPSRPERPDKRLLYYSEEDDGSFRGKWKKNTWRVYDRVYACLKKCGDFDDPWTVDSYQDCSCRSGHRYKKLAIITAKPPRTSCSSNYTSRYIRDERKYKVNTGKINIDHGDELGDVSVVINTQYIFTGSHNYPINKEVVWQFRIPSGKVAMVHFERSQFQLDQSSDDYVSISNSPAGGYKKILRGGDILEHTYVFSGKTLTIKFVSDEIGTSTGFEALIVFH